MNKFGSAFAVASIFVSTFAYAQSTPTTPAPIDDYTEYTYATGAGDIGSFADLPVQRTFVAPIKTIKVTIVSGQADDVGFVGGTLVTDFPEMCRRVGIVTAPVDVTDQVTVSGNTASFVLRAMENCCCYTGWGSATEGGRQNARFHWEVSFGDDKGCKNDVVRMSQGGGEPWANDLYDHSNTLTIQQKGCALTSLAMAINSAGLDFFPGQLNEEMKMTPGDFAGTQVNWDAAVRDVTAGTLKFFQTRSKSADTLKKMLCNNGDGHPVIVAVNFGPKGPGHFVLVTGYEDGKFLIADPGHADRTTLDDYGNNFETRGYVADPPGDISSLDVASGDDVEILVTNPEGTNTGFNPTSRETVEAIPDSVYFKDRLDDDETGAAATETGHIVQISQPLQGTYDVNVVGLSAGTYEVSMRVFAQDGSAEPPIVVKGIRGAGTQNTFELQVTTPPGSTSTARRFVTFQSALADVTNGQQIGLIDNGGVTASLSAKLQAAYDAAHRGQTTASTNVLNAFSSEVRAQTGKHIAAFAAEVLLDDSESLVRELTH